jgi:hypothetical protein
MKIKIIILFMIVSLLGCKSKQIETHDLVKDIPKEIKERYIPDLIQNKESAIAIAKIIIKEHYKDLDVDTLVLSKIMLVANDKVWEIVLTTPKAGFGNVFNIRVNKNTGEILNYWVYK